MNYRNIPLLALALCTLTLAHATDFEMNDKVRAESIFKSAGIPIDHEYRARTPFGLEPILLIAGMCQEAVNQKFSAQFNCLTHGYAAVCNLQDEQRALCDDVLEGIVLEYKKLFHFYLIHLYYLYDREVDVDNLMEIDEIVAANFHGFKWMDIANKATHETELIKQLSAIHF